MQSEPGKDRLNSAGTPPAGGAVRGEFSDMPSRHHGNNPAYWPHAEGGIRYLRDAADDTGDLRRFYRFSATACLVLAQDGTIRGLNPAAVRLLGGPAARLSGERFARYVSAEHRVAYEYFLAAVFARGGARGCEFGVLPARGGAVRPVLADATLNDTGQRCLLQLSDLTERRHMGAALEKLEAFSIGVLNSLPWHIAVLDPDGVIRAVNTAWQRFAIENGAEWLALHSVGLNYRSFCQLPPGDPDAARAQAAWRGIERVLCGELERFTQEYACDGPGRQRWFELTAYPLVSAQRGVVVAHGDISARKRAELSLQQARLEAERANNAKSRLLATVSHDLRQPLAALGLYVGLLDQARDENEAMLVRSMKDCVASLSALLTDVLNLSKLEAGALEPSIRDVPVDDLLDRVISVNAPEATLKRLSLRRARCAPGLTVRTDPALYARILDNLVSNAVRYTNAGAVLIGCRRAGGRRWVEVWDSGIGIAPESLREIFDEYRQLDNAGRTRGSGLGLAIADKLARLLGLQIRVASRPGKGSLFAVEMPPGRALHPGGADQQPLRKVCIALLETHPQALCGMAEALGEVGHQVVVVAGAAKLPPMPGRQPPDIVLADYSLAHAQAVFDAIARVRGQYGEELPVVMLADEQDPGILRSMAERGIVVQRKPPEVERLARCIARLTERRNA